MTRSTDRFALVGCGECQALWIVEHYRDQVVSECPECGHSKRARSRKALYEHDHRETVVAKRAAVLAERAGEKEAYVGDHANAFQTYTAQSQEAAERLDDVYTEEPPECLGEVVNGWELAYDYAQHPAHTTPTPPEEGLTDLDVIAAWVDDLDLPGFVSERDRRNAERVEKRMGQDHSANLDLPEAPDPDDLYTRQGDVRLAKGVQADFGETLTGVTPKRSNELPAMIDALLESCVEAVETLAEREGRPVERLTVTPDPEKELGTNHLADEYGIEAMNGSFGPAITKFARMGGVSEEDRRALTEFATQQGQATEGRDLDALRSGHVALLQAAGVRPTLKLVLDAETWTDLGDRRTADRLFDALDVLAEAVEIVLVASPRVQEELDARFGDRLEEWGIEAAAHLTQRRDTSSQPARGDDDGKLEAAYLALRNCTGGGPVAVLDALTAGTPRTVRSLKDDADLEYAPGSIGRYVNELETADLIDVRESTTESNEVTLTEFGKLAKRCISPAGDLTPPNQATIEETSYSPPTVSDKCSVSNADEPGRGDRVGTPAEWVAATGDPNAEGAFVEWLDAEGGAFDAYSLHRRHSAARRGEGVNLIDAPVPSFEDGQVTYLSLMEGDLHAVTEWGGAGVTLGRFAAALTDSKVWGTALDQPTVESLFEELGDLPEEVLDYLQRGMQVGHLNRDDLLDADGINYYAFRDALFNEGRRLLAQMGELDDMDDAGRSAYFRDAHGLLASMTALLDEVGVHTTFNVRFPDSGNLVEDAGTNGINENVRNDVVAFVAHTAPKHARYGLHNAYRQVVEDREEKLKFRLPVDLDPTDLEADLAASFVFMGEAMDGLEADVVSALSEIDPRDAVADGTEDAPTIGVPVRTGGTTAHARRVIKRLLPKKGWSPVRQDTDTIVRVLTSALSHATGRVSPMLVADALLGMGENGLGGDLRMADLRAGLTRIRAADLYSTVSASDSVGKLAKALVEADDPLTPKELTERAGIARKTYDRNWTDLAALGLVEKTEDNAWSLTLDPWWSDPDSGIPPLEDRLTETGDAIFADEPVSAHEVLAELANAQAWRGERDTSAGDLRLAYGRTPTTEELVDHLPGLDGWAPVIRALWPDAKTGGVLTGTDTEAVGRFSETGTETGSVLTPTDTPSDTVSIGLERDTKQEAL